jgi:hypothetical protein
MITRGSVRLRARLSAALVMASPPPPAATRIVLTLCTLLALFVIISR